MEQQPESILVELIKYNNWANQQLLAILLELPEDVLATSAPGAYGSIHRTLGHMIAAEADYVGRLIGDGPEPHFKWDDRPSIGEIAGFAEVVAEALLDAIQHITPDQMVHEEEDGNFVDYQARVLFMQAIEHGIEHRTNITTILNSLGVDLPELDLWGYATTHTARFKWQEGSR
jgi:uncharacterized damage-inducible protein DinB